MKKENDKKVDEQMSEEIRLHSQCDNPSSSHIKHRRKKVKIIITVVCCISVMVAGGLCALKYINNGNDNVRDTYSEYNSFMEGFTDVRITDEETAIEAVASVADVLGIDDAKNELKISNINAIGGDNYYCLQQYYNDIPVYGRTISVAADKDGTASALTSNFNRIEEKIELEPAVSKEDIEKSVKEYLGIDNVEIQQFSSENLVIYNLDNTNATLAYNLSVGGTDSVIVDAKTAEILLYKRSMNDVSAEVQSKDGTVTSIGWRNDDGSYHLYNDEYKIEVFDVNGITTVLDDNGDGKIDEKDQGKVHTNFKEYGIDTMYSKSNKFEKDAVILLNEIIGLSEYYKNFEFEGFERVHVAINDSYDNGKNARGGGGLWEGVKGAIMLMGDKFDFSCRGVMAHEYTHAVTGLIVGWNGKKLENSALNEAYSDVFGALYENSNNPDWKIEHLSKVERDLTDPEKTNGYDNMSDINAKDEYDQYTLSTIISHSAYLMWNGIDGQDNRKIDSTTLGNIWYRSMFLLQSNADFKQCRNAIELSARIMLRNKEITDEQYKTVISAFEEVGVENATFTFSKTVKNSFDLSVLNSDGTEDVNYKLEVIQMPKILTGPGTKNNQAPKTIMEKTSLEGRQHLDLKDGTYVLRLTDVSDDRNISQAINIKIVVNGNNASAADEVIINTDFTDVIVVVLNENSSATDDNMGIVDNTFAGGKGTKKDPYQVSTPEQLDAVRNNLSAHYIQTKDIDLSGWDNWIPIGKYMNSDSFSGVYDGNGFSIKNFVISRVDTNENYDESERDEQGIGLFATVWDGTLKNISIIDSQINIEDDSKRINVATISGLVCYVAGQSEIVNCRVSTDITIKRSSGRSDTVGGVVCSCDPDEAITIKDCKYNGKITIISGTPHSSDKIIGGILGECDFGKNKVVVDGCENTGDVIFTYTEEPEDFDRPSNIAGGIVGDASSITITHCSNKGNIETKTLIDIVAMNEAHGGIIGESTACKIDQCYNNGIIKGVECHSDIGGIVGNALCFTSGENTEVSNCYNTGEITGVHAGGISGRVEHNSSISLSYNVGIISGAIYQNSYYGSVIGKKGANVTINSCYCLDGIPPIGDGMAEGVVTLSAGNMKRQSSFEGFDFERLWGIDPKINAGYPHLK